MLQLSEVHANGASRGFCLDLFKEIISFVVNDNECREVLELDFPYCLKAELWVPQNLN